MRLNFSKVLIRLMGISVASAALFLMIGVALAGSPIIVDTLNDVNDTGVDCSLMVIGDLPGTDTKISLREAICLANNNNMSDTIGFSVTGTIVLAADFPAITEMDGLVIDGGNNIVLDGFNGARNGLNITGQFVQIKKITLIDFNETAIYLYGQNNIIGGPNSADAVTIKNPGNVSNGSGIQIFGTNNTVRNNFIGVTSDGMTKDAFYVGAYIQDGATGVLIEDNIIAGDGGCAIQFWPQAGPIGSVKIVKNKLNMAGNGSTPFAGGYGGVCDTSANPINGKVEILQNLISGSVTEGINLMDTYTGGVYIEENRIGTSSLGDVAKPNGSDGILINAACPVGVCVIGGIGKGNVISGNGGNGVKFGAGATNWRLVGNKIGLNVGATGAIANSNNGVYVTGNATGIQIGELATPPSVYNIISGNLKNGILIQNASGIINVSGNKIGTNGAGDAAIANAENGTLIDGGNANINIGVYTSNQITNLISGNLERAIRIKNTTGGMVKVFSSLIGLNATQTGVLPNVKQGILVDGESGNLATVTIGANRTNGYNVIAGNVTDVAVLSAIKVDDGSSAVIKGNFIGTNFLQTLAFGNGGGGRDSILILGDNVTIGGTSQNEGNIIVGATGMIGDVAATHVAIRPSAANTQVYGNFFGVDSGGNGLGVNNNYGVTDQGSGTIIGSTLMPGRNYFGNLVRSIHVKGSSGTLIANNYLGARPDGSATIPVLGEGIVITNNATGTVIGGANVNARNIIGNVAGNGIKIDGAANTKILGNNIGLAPDGVSDFGNGNHGINIVNANNTYIGRDGGMYGVNLISGNAGSGINLAGVGTITNVWIQGNKIGTNAAGTAAVPNVVDGINVSGGVGVVIGGTTISDRNIVSGNGDDGIDLNNNVSGVIIQGNYIGHGSTPGVDIGNTVNGLNIRDGANSNVVGALYSGGVDGSIRNLIDFNDGSGIRLNGALTVKNTIRGNFVGTHNTVNQFGFGGGANNSVHFDNTIIKQHSNAVIAGTTNLRGKVDFYSINPSNQISYEGFRVIDDNGNFYLAKPFTTTTGDRYFIQITTLDGNSTGYGVYKDVYVDASLPSRPTVFPLNGAQTSTPLVFSGAKDAYTSIWMNGAEVVASDDQTTWSYSVDLTEGVNNFTFRAKDEAGNQSLAIDRNIVLDTVSPAKPVIDVNVMVTGVADSPSYRILGTKEANSAIWLNGAQVIPVNQNLSWVYDVRLVEGSNSFTFMAKDPAGNVSDDVVVSIMYIKLTSYSGGESGGGSGGSGGSPSAPAPSAPAPSAPAPSAPAPSAPAPNAPAPSAPAPNAPAPSAPAPNAPAPNAPAPNQPLVNTTTPPAVLNPVDTKVVVDNVKNTYPVYTPNTTPIKQPVALAPVKQPIVGTQPAITPGTATQPGISQIGPQIVNPAHPAAPPVSTKFQNTLGAVTSSSTDSSAVNQPATQSGQQPGAPIQPVGVVLPGTQSNGEKIIIPSGMIDVAAITTRAEQQGIIIPSGVVQNDAAKDTSGPVITGPKPLVVNAPIMPPPKAPQNMVQVLQSPVYAQITNDNDGNGIPDVKERQFGERGLDVNADDDGDGVTNGAEILMGTNPLNGNTRGDGIDDGVAMVLGLSPKYTDSDQDGLSDAAELRMGTNPLSSDSDGDGISDALEIKISGEAAASDASVGVKDSDADGIPDAVEAQHSASGVGQTRIVEVKTSSGAVKQVEIKPAMVDTDGDGLTDLQEIRMGADPTLADSDGDGMTDSEEVKMFGTNPNEADVAAEVKSKPNLVRQVQGATFKSSRPSVPGYAQPNTPVTIYFIPRVTDAEITAGGGLLSSLGHLLMANLFSEQASENGYYKVDTVADAGGKFLAQADLPNGDYDVVVRTYDASGEVEEESLPFEIKVDTEALAAGEVEPYQLDDQIIDVDSLQLITLENSRPYLYGKAPRDYEVEVMWASELFTSSLLIESDEEMGEFVVMAPELLEDGDHGVVVQGIDVAQNLYTSAINVDFMVVAGGIYDSPKNDPMVNLKVMIFGGVSVIMFVVFGFISRNKKQKNE